MYSGGRLTKRIDLLGHLTTLVHDVTVIGKS
jgi:hypothetical protein